MDTRRTTCHRNCGSDWDLRLFKLESDRHCCGSFHQLFSYLRRAPVGTLITENAPTDETAVDAGATESLVRNSEKTGDWPSYNKSLTSERYSRLSEINTGNIQSLKVLCTYDTHQFTGFESGLIMVDGALIGTTEHDIFSIDPATCHQNWRISEDYTPATSQAVNRGAAYLDGRLFRGTEDGRVLAYDFATGRRVWETSVANPKIGETAPSAPIAWNGLVFIGTAGGDIKGVKSRMYALDALTGKIVWEFYLVPKAEGDPIRGPQGASPLDASSWKNEAGVPITLDLLYAGSGHRIPLCARRQPSAGFRDRTAQGRQFIYRLRCGARRKNRCLQKSF